MVLVEKSLSGVQGIHSQGSRRVHASDSAETSGVSRAASTPEMIMICTDCKGQDDACLRCDGYGVLCDVCGESPDACQCADGEEGELEDTD